MKRDCQNRLSNSHHPAMARHRDPVCDPRTRKEWQQAVDAAEALLRVDAAKQYGLVEGGPDVDEERCRELLEKGQRRGFRPREEAVEAIILQLAGA